MDGKGKAWCEELFEKINAGNPFPKLEKTIRETIELADSIIGEKEYAAQLRSCFSDYMNKSVGRRLRLTSEHGAFHTQKEIKEILAGIMDITIKYGERTRNNGSQDTSGLYRSMLFKIDTFYTPRDSDDTDSLHPEFVSIVPRRQPKNYKRKHDFNPEI